MHQHTNGAIVLPATADAAPKAKKLEELIAEQLPHEDAHAGIAICKRLATEPRSIGSIGIEVFGLPDTDGAYAHEASEGEAGGPRVLLLLILVGGHGATPRPGTGWTAPHLAGTGAIGLGACAPRAASAAVGAGMCDAGFRRVGWAPAGPVADAACLEIGPDAPLAEAAATLAGAVRGIVAAIEAGSLRC